MSHRYICSKCHKPHWKQVTEVDTFSTCCDAPVKRTVRTYDIRADILAKKQLRIQEPGKYPYFFGRKTFNFK